MNKNGLCSTLATIFAHQQPARWSCILPFVPISPIFTLNQFKLQIHQKLCQSNTVYLQPDQNLSFYRVI